MAHKNKQKINSADNPSWWQKRNASIKVAIIIGGLGILTAILPLFINMISNLIPPAIRLSVYQEFDWEQWLFAKDVRASNEPYRIITSTCLKGYTEDGIFLATKHSAKQTAKLGKLRGRIFLKVSSNKPILIDKVELKVTGFNSVAVASYHSIYYMPSEDFTGKGGAGVDFFSADELIIKPFSRTYDVLKGKLYRLGNNDAISLCFPIEFSNPGEYSYYFMVFVSSFSSGLKPILSENFRIKWMYLGIIDPAAIKSASSIPKALGNAKFRICQ